VATATEHHLITQAVLDYFEGWYDGDVARMGRAPHPELAKRSPGEERGTTLGITTKQRMLELTGQSEGREDGADRRLDVEVDDVCDDIASITVPSAAYHNFLRLVRVPDRSKIANARWRPR
jgi:hypothetical protein